MTTVIVEDLRLGIPTWVKDVNSFRRWTDDLEFPPTGTIWWLRGGVWADMCQEQIFTHLRVKAVFYRVLEGLVEDADSGLFLPDGLLVTNIEAGLSGNPDATYISHESRESGIAELIEGANHGYTEVVGSPDMVLEIVSDGSEERDLVFLPDDYFTAGIREFWRVDARTSPPRFDISRRNLKAFTLTRKQDGWMKSAVFGKSFRFVQTENKVGDPKYRLEVR